MKINLVLIFITALSFFFCKQAYRTEPESKNKKLILELFNHFNAHEWKALSELYIDSAFFLDPSFGKREVLQSHDQTKSKYSEMQKMFPDIKDDVRHIYVLGETVVVEFVSSGTNATGVKFSFPIVTIFTLRDEKIVRDATYYDQ